MSVAVSINLCCFNSEKYLRETLDSVVNQTYHDWELIIINDGSTDSTETIIKAYVERGFPITYHYQKNRGLSHSRNEALVRSHGNYIAFLDHDDVWLPNKLERQMAIFERSPDVDFIYTNYYVTRDNKKGIKHKGKQPEGQVFERFLINYPVHLSTAVLRRAAIDKLDSLFNPDLHLTEEYDFFMRLLYHGQARYISDPLATYRRHPGMTSFTQEVRLIRETIFVVGTFRHLAAKYDNNLARIIDSVILRNNCGLAFKLAKDELVKGDQLTARNLIFHYKFFNAKTFLLFLLTNVPFGIAAWFWLLFIKIKKMVVV